MNLSDIILIAFLFLAGFIFGSIASLITWGFNIGILNRFLSDSIFRNGLSLFLILLNSFLGTMIGFIGIIGFAADENAGEIFPYYVGISVIVSILCTFLYYIFKIR